MSSSSTASSQSVQSVQFVQQSDSASSLFPMSVPQVRKNLQLMRTAWSQHSPENVFYPSAPLPPIGNQNAICSFELFSYHQVKGNHNKRHQKRKSVPYQLANSTVIFEKDDEETE